MNSCPVGSKSEQNKNELPFSWKREPTPEGTPKLVVYLPLNQESFADSLVAQVFVTTAAVMNAEIRPTVKCTDEFKLEENQAIRLFLQGALVALRWLEIPKPVKGSTEFVAGYNHIVTKRLPYGHIPKRWLKCRTWELSKLMNRTSIPSAPKALSSLWSLWDNLPRWDTTSVGALWLKDLRSDLLPHSIALERVTKVMTELEKSELKPQLEMLNRKLNSLASELTLESIWEDKALPDLNSRECCVEKRKMQAKLDLFVPARLNLLYKDKAGRSVKKNKKVPINLLMQNMDLITFYIHFNPSLSLGWKCPSVPSEVLNAQYQEDALMSYLEHYEGDFPYKEAVLAMLARHLASEAR